MSFSEQELLALRLLKLVDSPSFPLRDPKTHFDFTWESMREVDRPVALKYEDFTSLLNSPLTVYQLIEGAMSSFSDAKARCDVLLKEAALTTLPMELVRVHVAPCQRVGVGVPVSFAIAWCSVAIGLQAAVSSNVFLWQLQQKLPKLPEPEHDDEHEGHGHSHGGAPCGGHGHGHTAPKRAGSHSHSHGHGEPECADDHDAAPTPPVVPALLEPVSVRVNTGIVGLAPSFSFA